MPLELMREKLATVLTQRCFYLFAALLLLLVMVPFLEDTPSGRIGLNVINVLTLVAAVATIGRSGMSLAIALLLGGPAIVFQIVSLTEGDPHYLALSRGFGAAFYFVTVGYLMAYVMRREVLTMDKLYGAAAAYIMIGILWGYFYLIVLSSHPGALAAGGAPMAAASISDIIYFSFTILTSTGLGDITPVHPFARTLCVFEQVIGILFIAILIARLAGTYPPMENRR